MTEESLICTNCTRVSTAMSSTRSGRSSRGALLFLLFLFLFFFQMSMGRDNAEDARCTDINPRNWSILNPEMLIISYFTGFQSTGRLEGGSWGSRRDQWGHGTIGRLCYTELNGWWFRIVDCVVFVDVSVQYFCCITLKLWFCRPIDPNFLKKVGSRWESNHDRSLSGWESWPLHHVFVRLDSLLSLLSC